MEASECMGTSKCMGASKCMGHPNVWGHANIWVIQTYGVSGHMVVSKCMGASGHVKVPKHAVFALFVAQVPGTEYHCRQSICV